MDAERHARMHQHGLFVRIVLLGKKNRIDTSDRGAQTLKILLGFNIIDFMVLDELSGQFPVGGQESDDIVMHRRSEPRQHGHRLVGNAVHQHAHPHNVLLDGMTAVEQHRHNDAHQNQRRHRNQPVAEHDADIELQRSESEESGQKHRHNQHLLEQHRLETLADGPERRIAQNKFVCT